MISVAVLTPKEAISCDSCIAGNRNGKTVSVIQHIQISIYGPVSDRTMCFVSGNLDKIRKRLILLIEESRW